MALPHPPHVSKPSAEPTEGKALCVVHALPRVLVSTPSVPLRSPPPTPSIPIEQGLSELLKEEGNRAQSWFFSAKVTEPPASKDHSHQGSAGP